MTDKDTGGSDLPIVEVQIPLSSMHEIIAESVLDDDLMVLSTYLQESSPTKTLPDNWKVVCRNMYAEVIYREFYKKNAILASHKLNHQRK